MYERVARSNVLAQLRQLSPRALAPARYGTYTPSARRLPSSNGLPQRLTKLQAARCFSESRSLYKKKEKHTKAIPLPDEKAQASSSRANSGEDPLDLSHLQDLIAAAVSKLKDDLSKVRVGGRFNTELLESLRVQPSKASKETVRLGELAQVVPKGGRTVSILASEEEHVKPISSAVISSNLSLTPQQDPHNPLQLNISIPPPTKESREAMVQVAKQAMEKAASSIRDSRGGVHKRLQDAQKKKIARPDDVKKTHEKMEKVVEKGQKDIKELFEAAKKALEQA